MKKGFFAELAALTLKTKIISGVVIVAIVIGTVAVSIAVTRTPGSTTANASAATSTAEASSDISETSSTQTSAVEALSSTVISSTPSSNTVTSTPAPKPSSPKPAQPAASKSAAAPVNSSASDMIAAIKQKYKDSGYTITTWSPNDISKATGLSKAFSAQKTEGGWEYYVYVLLFSDKDAAQEYYDNNSKVTSDFVYLKNELYVSYAYAWYESEGKYNNDLAKAALGIYSSFFK